MSASGQVDCLMIIYSRLFEVQPWWEVFIVPSIFHMDSLYTGLHWTPVHCFHNQVIPRFSITEVDWSPLESTGLNSPIGVHMDFDHWKIQPEWTGVQWTPVNCIRVSGLSCIAYLIKKKKKNDNSQN